MNAEEKTAIVPYLIYLWEFVDVDVLYQLRINHSQKGHSEISVLSLKQLDQIALYYTSTVMK